MTIWTYVVIALAVLGGMWCAWALVRGGTMKPAPAPPSRKPRGAFQRGPCPVCNRVVALSRVGDPVQQHICTIGSPWQRVKPFVSVPSVQTAFTPLAGAVTSTPAEQRIQAGAVTTAWPPAKEKL